MQIVNLNFLSGQITKTLRNTEYIGFYEPCSSKQQRESKVL